MSVEKETPRGKKNFLQKILGAIDRFQQKHRVLAYPYALVKKYGDDEAGYQAALITYYGFLSLFPLLIVAVSVIDLVSQHNPELRDKLLHSINNYLPIVGNQIQSSVHGSGKSGIALVIGLLITLWGAKGVADAVQHAMNLIWQVPRPKRAGFPKAPLKSLALILGAGIGLVGAALLSGIATSVGHSLIFKLLPSLLSVLVLFGLFTFVFMFAVSGKKPFKDVLAGAIVAAIGFQILQTVGGYLITHQLHNLSGAYGQFGLVLAILFWLYLQAQVLLYAAEVNTVHALELWPRSLTQDPLTRADRHALRLYAEKEAYHSEPKEEVDVKFNDEDTSQNAK